MIEFWLPPILLKNTKAYDTQVLPDYSDITGTVTLPEKNFNKVYGIGTFFLTQLLPGDWIINKENLYEGTQGDMMSFVGIIKSIEFDNELTLKFGFPGWSGTNKEIQKFSCSNEIEVRGDFIDISGG